MGFKSMEYIEKHKSLILEIQKVIALRFLLKHFSWDLIGDSLQTPGGIIEDN